MDTSDKLSLDESQPINHNILDAHDLDTHDLDTHDLDTHDLDAHDLDTHDLDAHDLDAHDLDQLISDKGEDTVGEEDTVEKEDTVGEEDTEDDDDEDNNEDDEYIQKFSQDIRNQYIKKFHGEINHSNYDEITALTKVVRNTNGNVIDPIHQTLPFLTKYEKTKIIGIRAKQINNSADTFIKVPDNIIDGQIIAEMELAAKVLPFIIARPLPNGKKEYWKLSDLEIIDY